MEASLSLTPTQPPSTVPSTTSSTAAELLAVRAYEVDHAWPHVVGFIERWVAEEALTSDEVKEYLKEGKAQLWCFVAEDRIRGIWVTRIERPNKCAWGLVWGCAGDFAPYKDDAIAMYALIEAWMKDKGCEFIEWAGREGWSRLFPGYTRHAIVMRKRL